MQIRAAMMLASLMATSGLDAQDAVYPPGVDAGIHESIQRGLLWLSRNQGVDGAWRNAGGYGTYPAAMTGLAGMAFVASGSTPTRGRYWKEVRRGVNFLAKAASKTTAMTLLPKKIMGTERPTSRGNAKRLSAALSGMINLGCDYKNTGMLACRIEPNKLSDEKK